MELKVETIPALSDNFIYVVSNDKNQAFVVDPSEALPVLEYLSRSGLKLVAILNTHHHWDHTGGNIEIRDQTKCEIYGAKADKARIPGISKTLEDGDRFEILGEHADVIGATGHTRGHILFYFRNARMLFSGDTLFSLGCGRLFEGSAEEMWNSMRRIRELPKDTRVYFGHEYTLKNGKFQKTIEKTSASLASYLSKVTSKIDEGNYSTPSTLEIESKLNLFMRADEPEVQKLLGVGDAVSAFSKLRKMKDQF